MEILGIDIGGSSIKGAPVDVTTGRLVAQRRRVETPKALSPQAMARAIAELARAFRWDGPIGIGFPGVINDARILTSDNLHPRFIGCDGGRLFGRALGRPVALTNDATAAALAEMTFGAGRGFGGKTLVLTLGTGIGSALCYRGVIFSCELGQLPWQGAPAEKTIASSARTVEGLTWREWAKRQSDYLAVLERIYWPELIVIGGGVSEDHRKFMKFVSHRAKLVPARFFNDAGIIGAALAAATQPRQNGSSTSFTADFCRAQY